MRCSLDFRLRARSALVALACAVLAGAPALSAAHVRKHTTGRGVSAARLKSAPPKAARTKSKSKSTTKTKQESRPARARKPAPPPPPSFTAEEANDAAAAPRLAAGSAGSAVVRAQVLLDRAHFPAGEIDGHYGSGTRRAVAAFNASRNLPGGEVIDDATWAELNQDTAPPIMAYAVTPEDVAGPFTPLPEEMMEKAKLQELTYSSPEEAIAEKFHSAPELLRALNPNATFDRAGAVLQVPSVGRPQLPKPGSVKVTESDRSLTVLSPDDRVLARFPATVGSEHDPLPVGTWKVNGVSVLPPFRYDPDLFWDAKDGDREVRIPPGPNSPVGVVWIDLSKEHYGIHGTAEPSHVGRTESHGCIRLTNWDAYELSKIVAPGTKVIFEK